MIYLILFLSTNLFAMNNKDLAQIKYYFSPEYKNFNQKEKSVHYSQSFFKYILAVEESSYKMLLKNERKYLKNQNILKILEKEDFDQLLKKFGQYKN